MNESKVYVLVIAHPDDESMFFVPTIRALKESGETVWLLCLTTGDYDGLGKEREKELYRAGRLLELDKVIVKNNLQDHPSNRWPRSQVKSEIEQALKEGLAQENTPYDHVVLLTFDERGVSGHVNHIDTFYGVCDLVQKKTLYSVLQGSSGRGELNLQAWLLESERNSIMKYIPVLEWGLLLLSLVASWKPSSTSTGTFHRRVYRCHQPALNWRAMAAHKSQFVWYRRFFVVFSCYTYVNRLHPIGHSKSGGNTY
jgi:N-acetylglucosaminylphosphatidylinositol deacetylase